MVVDVVPPPEQAQPLRVECLWPSGGDDDPANADDNDDADNDARGGGATGRDRSASVVSNASEVRSFEMTWRIRIGPLNHEE